MALTQNAPASMYRAREGLGLWEHRGKVCAVGIGHSPTARRWDERPETSIGAYCIDALRKAIADAGVSPSQVDGLVLDPNTTTGAWWPEDKPIPESFVKAFKPGANRLDGIVGISTEWLFNNMPELRHIKFTMYGPVCMSNAICVAAQAVGDGRTHTCLVLKGWDNVEGRYGQLGENAADTISGRAKWSNPWGVSGPTADALEFAQYLRKYGKSHDQMANFVVNEKRNGLLFPEGFWAQHRPEPLTVKDYLEARWIVKPLNLFDCDIPITAAAAYLFTTPERARNMKQKPVYILTHATTRPKVGITITLDQGEASTDSTARKLYEGAGITASDLSFENMYDGYTTFHVYFLEGLRFAGVGRGEALDFFEEEDISIEGPHPISPSGGNAGSGRTRFWMHTDSIQQLQGRAGKRQIKKKAEIGVSGGPMPQGGDFTVWSATPD